VDATITAANCFSSSESSCTKEGSKDVCNSRPVTNCDIVVSYVVEQEQLISNMNAKEYNTTHLKVGEPYRIWYNESQYSDITNTKQPRKAIGWTLFAFGLLILLIAIVSFYITQRFKFAAAATGVGSVAGWFN
jgi:hypothetical protein